MPQQLQQYAFITIFFILPGAIGGYVAWTKGRNPLGWLLLNMVFPPTLMVTLFQKPLKPVPGHYRQCPKCHEYNKWRLTVCKYCQTPLTD
jgi:hypothetical protein